MKKKFKVILIMVSSLNGKTTLGSTQNTSHWASKEDQKHFLSLIKKHDLIVMGRKTYESAKDFMQLKPGKKRIVMTKNPEKFSKDVVGGQLEFTDKTPKELVDSLKSTYTTLLLVGGGTINTLFFKEKLISELWITIEPKLFGSGNNIVDDSSLLVNFSLQSATKLNENGTLLLKYLVIDIVPA